jgi:TetR/AcrR family transcriptional regulator, lmrAB and yxaGH operons repressor
MLETRGETMASTRESIIEATCILLERQGYHATGLNQIVQESGAPKGSMYYHFPGGKEELTVAAIYRVGRLIAERIRESLNTVDDDAQAVRDFIRTMAHYVETADFRGGGPITTVALETAGTSSPLATACADAYGLWQDAFSRKLSASGFSVGRADVLAEFIVGSIEGALILSRTRRTIAPLQHLADELALLLANTSRV